MVCALAALTVGDADDVAGARAAGGAAQGPRATTRPPGCAPTPRRPSATSRRASTPSSARSTGCARSSRRSTRSTTCHGARRREPAAVGDRRTCARSSPATSSAGSPAGPATSRGSASPRALERSGARALLHFPPPARRRGRRCCSTIRSWARPFEIFSRALGHAVAQRGRSVGAARDRRAADVRLHVRRRRPGPRHRGRRASPCASASRSPGCSSPAVSPRPSSAAVRQRVQPARAAPAVDRAARRSADDPARAARRRRACC